MATNLSGNVSSSPMESEYFGPLTNPVMQAILTYSIPVVVLLGLFGNSVAFLLLKNSALRSTAHFYLCALALCDSLTLLSILASIWAGVLLKGHLYQLGWSVAWLQAGLHQIDVCRARLYLTFVCRTASTWMVAAFSWERCLAVWRPMRFEGGAVGWRSGLVLLGLVAAAAGLNAYVIPSLQPDSEGLCRADQLFRIGRNVSMLMHSLAPWLLVLVSNCLIACSLHKRQAAAASAATAAAGQTAAGGDEAVQLRSCQTPHLHQHHRLRQGVTYRLVAVSFAFLVSTSLLTVCTVWMTIAELTESGGPEKRSQLRDTAWLISFLPFTINFASSCPLYCLAGRKFRRAARLLVTCRLEQMRLARRLLDPSRPTSGLATATSARPQSDPGLMAVSNRRHSTLQQQQSKESPPGGLYSRRLQHQHQQQQEQTRCPETARAEAVRPADQVALMQPLSPNKRAEIV